jgi:hypothetical protein
MKKTILLIDAGYLHPTLREEGIFYDANMIAQIAKDCCVAPIRISTPFCLNFGLPVLSVLVQPSNFKTPKRIANKSFCCNSAISLLMKKTILLTRVHFVRTQRDLACAQMKFHKQMRDLLRFKLAYFQFNVTFPIKI